MAPEYREPGQVRAGRWDMQKMALELQAERFLVGCAGNHLSTRYCARYCCKGSTFKVSVAKRA